MGMPALCCIFRDSYDPFEPAFCVAYRKSTRRNPANRIVGSHYAVCHLRLNTLYRACEEVADSFAVLRMDRLNPCRWPVICFLPGSSPDIVVSWAEVFHLDRIGFYDKKNLMDVVG